MMELQNEIKGYLHFCRYQKKLSTLSLKAYTIDLRQFAEFCATASEQAVSKITLTGFIQELHQKYLPRTVKRKMASLRAFFNYLEFEEILDTNFMRKIKTRFQEPKQLPKTIPLRLIEQLLATAFKEHELATTPFGLASALRDRAILETLFATGVRVSELCSLKKDDINLDDGTINIMGKGTKERVIQIENSDVIKSLRQYQNANANNSAFFLRTGWAHATQNNPFVS
jgi:integrase/recombinase XerD